MNARITPEPASLLRDEMLLLVDFKWLMAGLGWWIDLSRWRRDPGYARECLVRGCTSAHAPLRNCARRLLARDRLRGSCVPPATKPAL